MAKIYFKIIINKINRNFTSFLFAIIGNNSLKKIQNFILNMIIIFSYVKLFYF